MDAILTGDASEEDYARAASAAVLIPMLGQQERLNGADLSFVQTAIDASRRAVRISARAMNRFSGRICIQ